ncbi:DUF3757 domain-containing protein [Legionella sp. D16C41]|uniref:DUF3757 domain-containing protein n=1 Tax=Legionella sp. D16C41 TaxID=3402688 RepID=UPI003AF6716D
MRRIIFLYIFIINVVYSLSFAAMCPDPLKSSLAWGEIPEPWQENPFSEHKPQGDEHTQFVRANIMVAGAYGRGIICTYKNTLGYYSIWWPVLVKIPARIDYNWVDTLGGYVCTQEIQICQFYPAI